MHPVDADRKNNLDLEKRIEESFIAALDGVVYEFAGQNKGLLKECRSDIFDSHPKGQRGINRTAKAIISYLDMMGVDSGKRSIRTVRDPQRQVSMGVPRESVNDHKWNTYSLRPINGSADGIHKFAAHFIGFISESPVFSDYTYHEDRPEGYRIISRASPCNTVMLAVAYNYAKNFFRISYNINGKKD